MISLDTTEQMLTAALDQWRGRTALPTTLGSAEIRRQFSTQILERSVFSAKVADLDYINEIGAVIDDMLSGKINQATARLRLKEKLKELGYAPEPGEEDSLQDLSSRKRLDLVVETNRRMAANYGRMVSGSTPYALYAYPAWELVRLYNREVPRGFRVVKGDVIEDPDNSWLRRWAEAAESVNWEGVLVGSNRLIALKTSPVWQALGNGEGGFKDTLGNPYPPFAFRSGFGWRDVPRAAALELFGALPASTGSTGSTGPTLTPGQQEVRQVFKRLSPDLQEAARKELGLAA